MTERAGHDDRRLEAIKALLRVRDLELRQAEGAVQKQQRRVFELETDVSRLEERCERLHPRDGQNVIERRMTLGALIRVKLARRVELECARKEATDLLPGLHSAQGRRDAVFGLWSRRRLDQAVTSRRRQDAADPGAARRIPGHADRGDG